MNKHITHIITCMLVILLGVAGGVGAAHAGPIVVDHFAIQKTNNDYIALVTLENLGGDTNEHTKVHLVDLEGDNEVYLGVKTVENKETFTFALSEYFNEADENELVKGQVYDMLVSTEDDTKTTSFFYGEESESDDSLITIEKVTVDGIKLQNDEQLEIMPGEELDVVIRFTALEDIDSARLTVSIEGHDEKVIMEHTDSFQAFEGVTYRKQLSVSIPQDLDAFESYDLKISGRNDLRNIEEKSTISILVFQKTILKSKMLSLIHMV